MKCQLTLIFSCRTFNFLSIDVCYNIVVWAIYILTTNKLQHELFLLESRLLGSECILTKIGQNRPRQNLPYLHNLRKSKMAASLYIAKNYTCINQYVSKNEKKYLVPPEHFEKRHSKNPRFFKGVLALARNHGIGKNR